eukprot:scaffold63830_cov18-Tisochrysis_lutea.AAC.1
MSWRTVCTRCGWHIHVCRRPTAAALPHREACQQGLPQSASSSVATKRPASEVLQAVAHAGNVSKASLVNKIAAIVVKTVRVQVAPVIAPCMLIEVQVEEREES